MTLHYIAIKEYCQIHAVDPLFLQQLEAAGVIEFYQVNEQPSLQEEQIPEIEIYTRFYYELGLNSEGIDVVRHLLTKIRALQLEIHTLKNRLSFYE